MFASTAFRFAHGSSFSQAHAAPLTDDQIQKVAPSVFADEAHQSRSARYAYIATAELLRGLRREGFEVFSARQAVTRDEARKGHAKHLLRLRHASQIGQAAKVGDSVPEILLLNSHDGSSSYQMMGGVFRFICSNGMVVPDGTCEAVKVPHTGRIQDRVIAGAFEVLDGLTRVIDNRDDMRALTLNEGEQKAFAHAAALLRFDPAEGEALPVTPDQVNRARRLDDRAPDLWTTFNRVQENVIRGGMQGQTLDANGRRQHRAVRAVTGIDQDVKLNRALWTLAEEMRKLKA